MIFILILSSMLSLIPLTLIVINSLISKKMFFEREKASSYECGFDPLNATAESFSIQFFLISIMFLTFDIEIVILIPMLPSMQLKSLHWIICSSFIMVTLIAGVIIEWMEGSIKWQK